MAVTSHAMPLGDKTGITDAERARIGAWVKAGAPTPQVFTVLCKKIFWAPQLIVNFILPYMKNLQHVDSAIARKLRIFVQF